MSLGWKIFTIGQDSSMNFSMSDIMKVDSMCLMKGFSSSWKDYKNAI